VTSKLALCEVTWQLTSKHIRKSLIVANLSMYPSERLVVSSEKEAKVPDSSLMGSGTVSTGKSRLSAGEYCLKLQVRAVEE
jgi:hypothetical protein